MNLEVGMAPSLGSRAIEQGCKDPLYLFIAVLQTRVHAERTHFFPTLKV